MTDPVRLAEARMTDNELDSFIAEAAKAAWGARNG